MSKDAPESWRLEQFAARLRLLELKKAIESEREWTRKRRDDVDAYLRERERLCRVVYGLPGDNYFDKIVPPPQWLEEYRSMGDLDATSKKAHFSEEA